MKKTYIIDYTVKSQTGHTLKEGTIKVKNNLSELQAKIRLETFLKKKHPAFGMLIIHKCRTEDFWDQVFGNDNPFTQG